MLEGQLLIRNISHLFSVSPRGSHVNVDVDNDIPGRRRGSLMRNISAKRGKWLRQASSVSCAAFKKMIAILALVKVI